MNDGELTMALFEVQEQYRVVRERVNVQVRNRVDRERKMRNESADEKMQEIDGKC